MGPITKALKRAFLNTPKTRKIVAEEVMKIRSVFKRNPEAIHKVSSFVSLNDKAQLVKKTYDSKFFVSVSKKGLPSFVGPGHGRSSSNPKAAYTAFNKGRIVAQGEGSRGGKIIGHTSLGRAIYQRKGK